MEEFVHEDCMVSSTDLLVQYQNQNHNQSVLGHPVSALVGVALINVSQFFFAQITGTGCILP
eukprot:COSAG02_NODE_20849_length_813_cov_1.362745_1_plen_62_part_00